MDVQSVFFDIPRVLRETSLYHGVPLSGPICETFCRENSGYTSDSPCRNRISYTNAILAHVSIACYILFLICRLFRLLSPIVRQRPAKLRIKVGNVYEENPFISEIKNIRITANPLLRDGTLGGNRKQIVRV